MSSDTLSTRSTITNPRYRIRKLTRSTESFDIIPTPPPKDKSLSNIRSLSVQEFQSILSITSDNISSRSSISTPPFNSPIKSFDNNNNNEKNVIKKFNENYDMIDEKHHYDELSDDENLEIINNHNDQHHVKNKRNLKLNLDINNNNDDENNEIEELKTVKRKKPLNLNLNLNNMNEQDESKNSTVVPGRGRIRFAEPLLIENDHKNIDDDEENRLELCLRKVGVGIAHQVNHPKLRVEVDPDLTRSWKIDDAGQYFEMNEFIITKSGKITEKPQCLLDEKQPKFGKKTPKRSRLTRSMSITALHDSKNINNNNNNNKDYNINRSLPRSSSADHLDHMDDILPIETSPVANFTNNIGTEDHGIGANDLIELNHLGRGNGGTVTRALNKKTFEFVAVKHVEVSKTKTRHQIRKELIALRRYKHKNIVGFKGVYYDSAKIHVVLEYMDRGSLQSIVEDYGALNEPILKSICKQVVEGLKHIHSWNGVHRDIKPANILVNHLGEVKLADFGISCINPEQARTYAGTTIYMSPERIQSGEYSGTTDIWSLGLTLIFCALGKAPVHCTNVFDAINTINEGNFERPGDEFSSEFHSLLDKCLKIDRHERWSASQLLHHPFLWNDNNNNNNITEIRPISPPPPSTLNVLELNTRNNSNDSLSKTPPAPTQRKRPKKTTKNKKSQLITQKLNWGYRLKNSNDEQELIDNIDEIMEEIIIHLYKTNDPFAPLHNSIDQKRKFEYLAQQLDCDVKYIYNSYEKKIKLTVN